MQDVATVAGAILTAATMLAAALRWAAGVIAVAVDRSAVTLKANTEAQHSNTEALDSNTRALRASKPSKPALGPVALLFLLLFPWLLSGCAAQDALTIRALERDRQVWEEDRRKDLDPELVKSRAAEFDAHLRYERSK